MKHIENLSPFYDTFYWAISNTWPMLTLFVVIIVVLRLSRVVINHDKFVFYKDFYSLLFIIYMLLLYFLLLTTEDAVSGINLKPFTEMTRYTFGSKAFFYNVVGNIALFIPFGYFVSDYLKAKRLRHIAFVALVTSLTAELIQYKIGRAFDIDDIILNFIGAIIGFIVFLTIKKIKRKLPSVLQNNIFYNIIAIIILIIIIFAFGSMWGLKLW